MEAQITPVRNMKELRAIDGEIIMVEGVGRRVSINDDEGMHCFLGIHGEYVVWTAVDRGDVDFSADGKVIVIDYDSHTSLLPPGSNNHHHLRYGIGSKLD